MNYLFLLFLTTMVPLIHGYEGFRSGTISWEQVAGANDGLDVEFTFTAAFTASYFGVSSDSGTVDIPSVWFYPNDGDSATTIAIQLDITSYNSDEDWFIGTQSITHSYDSGILSSGYTASVSGCCLPNSLLNDAQEQFTVSTEVNIDRTSVYSSPKTMAYPIMSTLVDDASDIEIVALLSSADNALRFELVTDSFPSSASIDSTSGLVSWTPTQLGTYHFQARVEEHLSSYTPTGDSDNTNRASYVTIDFLVEVVDTSSPRCKNFCQNPGSPCVSGGCTYSGSLNVSEPYCDINTAPVLTSVSFDAVSQDVSNPLTKTLAYDTEFVLEVKYTDVDDSEDSVTMYYTTVPDSASVVQTTGNEASTTVTWTPTTAAGDSSTVVCFSAVDSILNVASGQTCISLSLPSSPITVSSYSPATAGSPQDFTFTSGGGASYSVALSGTASLLGSSSGSAPNFDGSFTATVSGYYYLTITDTTSKVPKSVPVLVNPASPLPSNYLVFDSSSIGTLGGEVDTEVFFYVQLRDTYDNIVTTDLSSSIAVTIDGESVVTSTTFVSDGLHRIAYVMPSAAGAYTVRVLQDAAEFDTFTVTAVDSTFTAAIVLPGSFDANEVLSFQLNVTTGTPFESVDWLVMIGDVEATSVTFFADNIYDVTGSAITTSSPSVSVTVFAPGLANGEASSDCSSLGSSTCGTRSIDSQFEVLPLTASASTSVVTNIPSVVAYNAQFMTVLLKDSLGNTADLSHGEYISFIIYDPEGDVKYDTNATLDGESGEYQVFIQISTAGQYMLDIVLHSDTVSDESVANSNYTFAIIPDEFSFSSAFSPIGTVVAGETSTAFFTATDAYNNARFPGEDSLQVTFANKLGTVTGNSSFAVDLSSNAYHLYFATETSGSYDLQVKVYSRSRDEYVTYQTETVTVIASDAIPANSLFSGTGLTEGSLDDDSLVIMQARDQYLNILDDADDYYYILRVTVYSDTENPTAIVDTYYFASYNEPTSQGYCDFTVANVSDASDVQTQLVAGDGYWEVSYNAPVQSSGSYNMEIYFIDLPLSSANSTAEQIANSGDAELVYEGEAEVIDDNGTGDDSTNWEVATGAAIGGAAALAALGYGGYRLHRYRPKFKEHQKRRLAAEKKLEELGREVDIIPAHGMAEMTNFRSSRPSTKGKEPLPDLEQIIEAEGPPARQARPVTRKEFAPARPKQKATEAFDDLDGTSTDH